MSAELRTDDGYPLLTSGPKTRPRAKVECQSGAAITAPVSVDQSQDNSTGKRINDALPWAVLAAMFGGMGFAGVLVLCVLAPWETADRAARAEIEASFSQRMASVEVEAHNAASISEVWRNRVNKLEAEANANRRR